MAYIHMVGVLDHWPSRDHSCWKPPFTSIQSSPWCSTGLSARSGLTYTYVLHTLDVAKLVAALGLCAHLYANETHGHCSSSNSFELSSQVLRAIDSIHEYMSSNRLSLNTGDTQFIRLGTNTFEYSLANRDTNPLSSLLPSLTELISVRNLGFIIDQELSMKDHITKLGQS